MFLYKSTPINGSQKIILRFQIRFLTGGILGHSNSHLIFLDLYVWLLSTDYSASRVSWFKGLVYCIRTGCVDDRIALENTPTAPFRLRLVRSVSDQTSNLTFTPSSCRGLLALFGSLFFILDTTISVTFHMTNWVQHNFFQENVWNCPYDELFTPPSTVAINTWFATWTDDIRHMSSRKLRSCNNKH